MSDFPTNNAWSGTVASFLSQTEETLCHALATHYRRVSLGDITQSHQTAWLDSVRITLHALKQLTDYVSAALGWTIVFEYELPRERGRRPDIVILTDSVLFVVEAKGYASVEKAHVDQVQAYARDLIAYQSKTQSLYGSAVVPVLLLTRGTNLRMSVGTVQVVSANFFADLLAAYTTRAPRNVAEPASWLLGEYEPLPSLVSAARMIFRDEPFPQIHRAASSGIDAALDYIAAVARQAEAAQERHIVFLTGVPGAGKTLIGIRFVYEYRAQYGEKSNDAVLLSGNGPLVNVLQHALKSRVFVQDVHGFLKEYTRQNARLPREHIIIYDEAQRAWDATRSAEKRGTPLSEPDDFLAIGSKQPDWALMVALIGQGQEIHLGEEAGMAQWDAAIAYAAQQYGVRWVAHAPLRLRQHFVTPARLETTALLDLDVSLRSHTAEDVQNWVAMLLNQTAARTVDIAGTAVSIAHLEALVGYADQMFRQGYTLYLTRDIERAKAYVKTRYRDEPDKRYGLLASSKATNLMKYGVLNEFHINRTLREGPWFNDAPDSERSCCQLALPATEFQSQGLELDMPIVCWGDDVRYERSGWQVRTGARSTAKDPRRLRINAYRVLLSRGRDGMVIFVPADAALDATAALLLSAGCRSLDSAEPFTHPDQSEILSAV